ncbi:hypothetical protein TNCV_1675421 [Trichonephila clavipes]|nr:hypothetical protein TNCV_1675421 [Trichonephila clavipes]
MPKNPENFPSRRSTLATPPRFHRPTNRRHATQQTKNPLSSSPTSKFYQDMGLRTVLQSGCPKENAYSTPCLSVLNCLQKKS